jgi:hypothetical protein
MPAEFGEEGISSLSSSSSSSKSVPIPVERNLLTHFKIRGRVQNVTHRQIWFVNIPAVGHPSSQVKA